MLWGCKIGVKKVEHILWLLTDHFHPYSISGKIIPMADPLPTVFLGCRVFEGLIEARLRPDDSMSFTYNDWLHSYPKQLNETLQAEIDKIEEPSLILLGYGLCGNGLDNLEARQHTLVVPKADDCITLFMGSREEYLRQFYANPGTYYITKGWVEVGGDPLSEYEDYVERYGEKKAKRIMDIQYQNYKRLMFVAYDPDDFETFRYRTQAIAEYCSQWGMVYEEYLGNDDFFNRIAALSEKNKPIPEEFIVVPPGGVLKMAMFLGKGWFWG